MGDEAALPWGRAEKPEKRVRLEQYLEGQQIALVHFLDSVGFSGSRGLAFELTSGAKLIAFAGRSRDSNYSALILFRWMPRPIIVLPRMARVFSGGRIHDPQAGPPDDLQRWIEGAVVRGIINHSEPAARGGEWVSLDFTGGMQLHLISEPIMKLTDQGETMVADLTYIVTKPETQLFSLS